MKVPPFVAGRIRWDTIQQLIRMGVLALAGYLFGADWSEDPMIANAVSGAVAIVTLIWWQVWNHSRGDDAPVIEAPPVQVPDPAPAPVAPTPVAEEGTTTTVTTTTKAPEKSPIPKEKPK